MSALIDEYEKIYRQYDGQHYQTEIMRRQFVNDYPVSKLKDLSLEDYLISKEGQGNDRSFCRRMRYDLQWLSSMGNVRFNIFGVYTNPNGNIALSPTYKKLFGDDISSAFKYIKKEIVTLLKAAEKEDYDTIDSVKLNSSFRYKLITVYYPDLYVPVVTNDILKEYCDHVSLYIDPYKPMVIRNVALRDYKDSNPEMKGWSNFKLMGFCDWLWRAGRYYQRPRSR